MASTTADYPSSEICPANNVFDAIMAINHDSREKAQNFPALFFETKCSTLHSTTEARVNKETLPSE